MRRVFLGFGIVLLLVAGLAAGEKKNEPTSDLSFVVTKQTNGKPVRNASVVLHIVDKDGRQGSGGINLKTDSEGKTQYRGIPYGKLRIQVIARGFQTFGDDIDINKPTHEVEIKMQPPKEQYSIYK